jgi:hypothetical protein
MYSLRVYGAGALIVAALVVLALGQPTAADKYATMTIPRTVDDQTVRFAPEELLSQRLAQIHPGELLASLGDARLNVILLDVRPEADYNLFHLRGAQRADFTGLEALVPELLTQDTSKTVVVVMSNDEAAATEAWRLLVANSVANVYILEGGINNWIHVFGAGEADIVATPTPGADALDYSFPAALGDRYEAADPAPHEWTIEYVPKIQLQRRRGPSGGGCG